MGGYEVKLLLPDDATEVHEVSNDMQCWPEEADTICTCSIDFNKQYVELFGIAVFCGAGRAGAGSRRAHDTSCKVVICVYEAYKGV